MSGLCPKGHPILGDIFFLETHFSALKVRGYKPQTLLCDFDFHLSPAEKGDPIALSSVPPDLWSWAFLRCWGWGDLAEKYKEVKF